eukprot:3875219-Pleurochrysis_carterae.AAC.5
MLAAAPVGRAAVHTICIETETREERGNAVWSREGTREQHQYTARGRCVGVRDGRGEMTWRGERGVGRRV